jgi:flagellar basal-body rod modification protein FlgD
MADGIPPVTSSNGSDTGATAKPSATPGKVDKNMFLQLLVAQLRHQDPMKPSDGTQFIGQLAQFEQLETSLNVAEDVAAIRESLGTSKSIKTQS